MNAEIKQFQVGTGREARLVITLAVKLIHPRDKGVVRFYLQDVSTGYIAWKVNFNFTAALETVGFPTLPRARVSIASTAHSREGDKPSCRQANEHGCLNRTSSLLVRWLRRQATWRTTVVGAMSV